MGAVTDFTEHRLKNDTEDIIDSHNRVNNQRHGDKTEKGLARHAHIF